MKEGGSGSGGREGGLRKGTSEEGTELSLDEARERGREEASIGGRVQRSEGEVQRGAGEEGR